MDNALQSLTNTLDAINSRQAAARKRARKGADATPFTSAVLNRERLEIYTYIRDADAQTEANLFWYPPVPQAASSSRAGPSSSNHRAAHDASVRANGAVDANDADLLLAPRLPEPRHIAPPTPLRNNNVASNKQSFQNQNDQSVDPRVLLLAAQRLNDTCGKGSRTRKHIKGLLKTHAGYIQDIKSYEQQIRQWEAQLRATAEGKPISQFSSIETDTTPAASTTSANEQLNADLAAVQDSIKKEELEILALGEMLKELRDARTAWQKQELDRQQRAEAAAEDSRMQQREQTPPRAAPRASLARAQQADAFAQPSAHHAEAVADEEEDDLVNSTMDVTQQSAGEDIEDEEEEVQHLAYSTGPYAQNDEQHEAEISVSRSQQAISASHSFADPADLTIQRPREHESYDSHHELADTSAAIDPAPVADHQASPPRQSSHLLATNSESSEELERATEKVWEVFGEALRSVAPERESADYYDTLDVLKLLMSGGDKFNAGDYSVGSVQTSSTFSSAASEASAAVAAQLTPEVLMTAFVIFQMLVSDEPHRMNIDELKLRGHEWWSTAGMQVWLHAQSHDDTDVPARVEAFEDGQNLARKATYGMISKQLFAIKRQKGVGLVGFA
ncbi:hypothetical protein PSEUBRA_001565 [Kalmanozyma brasiliensis GHG001]|uniref:Uncharacterized protein n=1 Tax=Kalmanozyma brasiliensis (strain GHG001) TaxID=1365824 RepID=V5EED5_KALBG|nr:uncharacterized protein PSEUBRA_001565 [Kalmanozyma brasiliensis GHG001]EST08856.1 hypothetical protein PSEUBRA_001565 [Kalmanozyma brasiliensis GHG001]